LRKLCDVYLARQPACRKIVSFGKNGQGRRGKGGLNSLSNRDGIPVFDPPKSHPRDSKDSGKRGARLSTEGAEKFVKSIKHGHDDRKERGGGYELGGRGERARLVAGPAGVQLQNFRGQGTPVVDVNGRTTHKKINDVIFEQRLVLARGVKRRLKPSALRKERTKIPSRIGGGRMGRDKILRKREGFLSSSPGNSQSRSLQSIQHRVPSRPPCPSDSLG